MTALALTITDAGLAALPAPGGSSSITISAVGLTDQAFVAARTLTALPGEFDRLTTVSGAVVAPTIVSLTMRDEREVSYGVRGFGLYLTDGTLFAVYGQADEIFEKSAQTIFLEVIDITFAAPVVGSIVFGDATFIYPPATETVKGVAEIATDAEVAAASDDQRFVTPKKLGKAQPGGVASLGNDGKVPAGQLPPYPAVPVVSVNGHTGAVVLGPDDIGGPPNSRQITGGGLATGGGSLAADRQISVPKASAAEVLAGLADDKAITPLALAQFFANMPSLLSASGYMKFPNGVILQWGNAYANPNSLTAVAYPITFPNGCWACVANGTSSNDYGEQDNWPAVRGSPGQSTFYVMNASPFSHQFGFFAIGF